ncbi:MAG: DUF4239 domain-containing protein [Candidatus Obscuribacterales bacterium]|nr:DUF4239 domain-containing protein [Candidatus Obscuribacterales bacterium]
MFGTYWFLSLLCLSSVAAAISGLLVVRRYAPHELLRLNHEVSGYMFSTIGTLYSVILGLVVVGSLNTFDQARLTVAQEANSLHDIYHLAHGLPPEQKISLRKLCLEYAQIVITNEWPLMNSGKHSEKAHDIVSELWNEVVDFKPTQTRDADLHAALLTEVNTLGDNRETRLNAISRSGDAIIWAVLVFGGAVLVLFTYLFSAQKFIVQLLTTTLITLILALNLAIVAMYGYPFSGDVHVSSLPFENFRAKHLSEITTEPK